MNWTLVTLERYYKRYLSPLIDLNVSLEYVLRDWSVKVVESFNLGPEKEKKYPKLINEIKKIYDFHLCKLLKWMNSEKKKPKRIPKREIPREGKRERGQRGAVSHLGPKKVFKCHPHYFELHSFRLMRGPRLRFEPIQKKRKKKRSKANKTYNNQQQQQTKAPLLSIKIERGLQRVQIIGFRLWVRVLVRLKKVK